MVLRHIQIQVPLTGSSAGLVDMTLPTTSHSLLPSTHLTPKTLLGGGGEERETLGQLYAAQIASQMSLRAPDDRRTLVLGLGLESAGAGSVEREAFYDLLELAQRVL
jgi:proteasome assembly chaperone 3